MSDEDLITHVARTLCVVDGKDPDVVVTIGTEEIEADPSGIGYRRTAKVAAWTIYVVEAQRMVVAVRAMGLLE